MRRRRLIGLVVVGVLVASCAIWFSTREREPRYKGRTLSEWLLDSGEGEVDFVMHQREALRHMDTNALPLLLKWLQYEQSPWREKLSDLLERLPGRLYLLDRSPRLADAVVYGFMALGAQAEPATPDLIRLMCTPTSRRIQYRAAEALGAVGSGAVPALIEVLTNSTGQYRRYAALSLSLVQDADTNANAAVPVLLRCLREQDKQIVQRAATALGNWRAQPEISVPALVPLLLSTDAVQRVNAVESIRSFREAARFAGPALLAALSNLDGDVRIAATNALRCIAPEALDKVNEKPVSEGRK